MFRSVAAAALVSVCGIVPAEAQQSPATAPASTWWIAAGLGGGTEGVAVVAEATFQAGSHQISARGSVMSDIWEEGVFDLGLLYSRSAWVRGGHFSFGAGVAYVGYDDCASTNGCGVTRHTVGLPFMARAMWRPAQGFGLGIYGFGNINSLQSYAGAALSLALGKVR